MAYTKTNWVNGTTPINDTNLNHIEQGIYDNDQSIAGLGTSKQDTLIGSGTGQNIKTINDNSLVGTGNIQVQPTLVSGTNIKSFNGATLLTSGNINVSLKKINSNTGTNITLSESIQNFDFLLVIGGANSGANAKNSLIIPVPDVKVGNNADSWAFGSWQTGSVNYQIEFTFPSNTSISATAQVSIWSSPIITKVYGIKIPTS